MDDNKIFTIPPMASKYIIRKTCEEVEVLAFNQPDKGGRSNYEKHKADYEYDWVSYIDSKGVEHIKEHLNILFDFKPVINDTWNSMFNWAKNNKMPSTRNCRIFEVAKELYLNGNRGYGIKEAVEIATNLVDKVGIEIK